MDNPKKTGVATMDKFELAEDKLFDYLIEKGGLLDDPSNKLLLPPSQQRAKLKKELHEAAENLDLDIDLAPALHILTEEGTSYLDAEMYEEMARQLADVPIYLEQLDLSQPPKESLYASLHISENTMLSIYKIGVAKYEEENLEAALSLFGFLATLDHQNEEWLYRLGITATQMEEWDQALKAFTFALFRNPDLLGARLFSAECYLMLGQKYEANEEIKEAKRLIQLTSPEPFWLETLTTLEGAIK